MAKTRALVTFELKGSWPIDYRPRGPPNTRIKSQSGITITAPSRK
jgi:hypothetical protein